MAGIPRKVFASGIPRKVFVSVKGLPVAEKTTFFDNVVTSWRRDVPVIVGLMAFGVAVHYVFYEDKRKPEPGSKAKPE